MKLSDSLKYALKIKSREVFTTAVIEAAKNSFQREKRVSFKQSLIDLKENTITGFLIIKELPSRFQMGFQYFLEEYVIVLSSLNSPSERAKFAMKTLACLSRIVVSGAYDLGMNNANLIPGKRLAPFSKLVMARMVFKTLQGVVVHRLDEINQHVEKPEEKEMLQRYKEFLLDDKKNAVDMIFEEVIDVSDPAVKIVENFKNYIFTGERISR